MRVRFSFWVVFCLAFFACMEATLSKSKKKPKEKKKKTPVNNAKLTLPTKTVIERGLVMENVTYDEVVQNFPLYSKQHKNNRRFEGDVLAYVTPWNNHGYDVAKTFGKFTMVSPVWLQIKRKSGGKYNVEGTQDIDHGWMKDLGKMNSPPKIVPRVLFDSWSQEEYRSLFQSEDEIESMTQAIIDVLKENNMHGAVIEIWSQIGSKYPDDVIHVVKHMAEIFHENNLMIILVVPAAIIKDQKVVTTFGTEQFEALVPLVDYFSLMTYDFSTNSGHAGPSSPIPWMKMCVEHIDPKANHRAKILMGLNFYGYMFSQKRSSPMLGNEYIDFLRVYKPEILWEKSVSEHYSKISVGENAEQGFVFFPSLKSIEDRLNLAKDFLGTGISIWEIGQGLDYFYDLL